MNRKVITKVLATFLAFTLSFANVALLGSYMSEVDAGTIKLEEQETMVQKTDLEFDAYMKEEGKDVHSKTIDVAEESEILYLKIKAGEGYLTNASIKIEEKEEELALIQSISSEENKIVLNQINKGESALIEIPIKINAGSSFDVKDLSKVAEIKLEGTYINNKGKEVKVNKTMEVETIIDGIAEANLSLEVSKYVSFNVSGSKGVILQTLLKSNLVDNKLPVKSTKLEIEIPKINNIEPKEIAISSRSEEATNGKKARVFNEEDYKNEERKTYISIRKRRRNAFMDEKCK